MFYIAVLWAIPYVVSHRALSDIRKRAAANVLIHRPPNTADNCRIPMAIADAMMSICVFDVTKCPLRIRATIPRGLYWSISSYASNTDNFFVMNDTQTSEPTGEQVAIVLQKSAQGYQPRGGEIVVDAPSNTGIVIIRMAVSDPTNLTELTGLSHVQRRAYAAEVDNALSGRSESAKFRVDVFTPDHEIHVRICLSIEDIERMISRDYHQTVAIEASLQGKMIDTPGGYRIIFDSLARTALEHKHGSGAADAS